MDPYERSKLGDAIKEEKFHKDEFIIREGEAGDKFYIISEGTTIATKKLSSASESQKVMDYSKGMYFGERALLTNDLRAANIVATSDVVECLSLERDTFIRMLGPLETLLKRNMEVYAKYNSV
jgi:CRP-like cAMP-binding protein